MAGTNQPPSGPSPPQHHDPPALRGDEEVSKKFWSKARDAPYVPAGILGTLAVIGYGVYDFKNRGNMSASVYIMQYRVKAQSVVVGALTLGVTYSLLRDYVFHKKKDISAI
jgi:hypothetical protein